MNVEGKKLVIWDFDGTIVHLNADWVSARKRLHDLLSQEYGMEFAPEERTLTYMEYEAISRFDDPNDIEKVYEIRNHFESADLSGSTVIQHAVGLFRSLNGVKQAMLSNNLNKTIQRFVEEIDLKFDLIVGLDDVDIPKPDTKGCKMILDHFGVSPDEVIFIGDNPATDGEVCRKMGIEFIHVDDLR